MDITFLHVLQCVPHVHVGVVHLSVGRAHGGSFGMLKRANIKFWPKDGGDENHATTSHALGAISS